MGNYLGQLAQKKIQNSALYAIFNFHGCVLYIWFISRLLACQRHLPESARSCPPENENHNFESVSFYSKVLLRFYLLNIIREVDHALKSKFFFKVKIL